MTAELTGLASRSRREYIYRFADSTLKSNILFPELDPALDGPGWCFRVDSKAGTYGSPCEWFHQWRRPSGALWLLLGRLGTAYLLRFTGLADFHVRLDQLEISCAPCSGVPRKTVRHLLLDQVFPLVLSERRQIIIHASAVVTPCGAIAFAASSGAGKSTLAAYLSMTGYPLLADDCLVLEERANSIIGTALYSGARLLPDSVSSLFEQRAGTPGVSHYSDKRRIRKNQGRMQFHPLPGSSILGVYFLSSLAPDASESVVISPIAGVEAFLALAQSSFVMDAENPQTLRNQFQCLQSSSSRLQFRRLSFTRDYAVLPQVRNAIEKDTQLLARHAS